MWRDTLNQRQRCGLLQRGSWSGYYPAFYQKLLNGSFLDALLNPQFVVEKMVGNASGAAISADTVNANAVAVAIGANQAYLQIALRGLPDASRVFLCRHFGLDEKRLGSECGKLDNATALFRVYWLSLTAVKPALPKLRARAMIRDAFPDFGICLFCRHNALLDHTGMERADWVLASRNDGRALAASLKATALPFSGHSPIRVSGSGMPVEHMSGNIGPELAEDVGERVPAKGVSVLL